MFSRKCFFLFSLLICVSICNANNKNSSQNTRYRYKAEAGAYIEASRKEIFSVCPDKEIQGTWISEYSVSLNAENCVSVQAPNIAGTIRILFMQNSGSTDTIQVLVDQSYIQMGNYTHKVWVDDITPIGCFPNGNIMCGADEFGHYENRKYEHALIVDKTEFTMGDAQYYSKFGIKLNSRVALWETEAYPNNENLKTSTRPYLSRYDAWKFANIRSKLEGLDTIYRYISADVDRELYKGFTFDTSAFGYRLPSNEEWGMLMRAGASTRYFWGDEEDSLTVSRYTLVRPIGYTQHKVAQKQPNAFGLYDMISPNNTNVESGIICPTSNSVSYRMRECYFLNKIARQVESKWEIRLFNKSSEDPKYKRMLTSDFNATSMRFVRKTPKLYKLDKF